VHPFVVSKPEEKAFTGGPEKRRGKGEEVKDKKQKK
jgi:hypothetical protein